MKKILTLKNGIFFYINNFYITKNGDLILKNNKGITTFMNGNWKRFSIKK